MNLTKKIQNISHQYELWKKGSKIVLGVSGGPDSVCMLDIFSKLQKKYALELIIAHVNYGLRGQDSEKDEKFVRNLSEKYNIKAIILKSKISAKNNLEDRLRKIRYDFFEEVRSKNDFDSIAIAHNLDDQAETFLMRIMRGSGLLGLSAMKHKTGKLIRPLLSTTRADIMDYLKSNQLTYRTDKTNKEVVFLRNKIRNKLLPYLEKNFNPSIKKTIFEATLSIAEDYSLLNKLAKKTYSENQTLSSKAIANLHPALQKRVLLEAIRAINSNVKDIESKHIIELLKAIKSTKGKNQTVLFKGLKMVRKGDKVEIMCITNK